MQIHVLDGEFSICKLASAPDVLPRPPYFAAHTEDEYSLVCLTAYAPDSFTSREDGWRAFHITGTLDFSLTGILSKLSAVLAQNGIGIFAVSTYDTDYVLVKSINLPRAVDALKAAGYAFTQPKALESMTLSELWQLFPIQLTAHKDIWREWYAEEAAALRQIFPAARISHMGSTAISDICAKPIIDILLELDELPEADIPGYRHMSKLSYNKGYTEYGFSEKVFHLHVRRMGDNDELYFRDYLLSHADTAREYEKLKLSLCEKYKRDRDGYTNAKTAFIEKYTALAKEEFGARY